MKIRKKRVVLQEKDYLVLKFICDFGYLTPDHVAKYVFLTSNKNARRRLFMLEQAGFIQGIFRRNKLSTQKIYIPNFKNINAVVYQDTHFRCISTMQSRPWFRPNFNHEDTLRNYALRIHRLHSDFKINFDYMHHHFRPKLKASLSSGTFMIPNMTIFEKNELLINIEVELTAKTNFRYCEKFRKVLTLPRQSTLYLVRDHSILNKINIALDEVQKRIGKRSEVNFSIIRVCLESDVDLDQNLQNEINFIRDHRDRQRAQGNGQKQVFI